MNILYDNQIFTTQKFGGISRYFYELIRNLDNDITYELPIYLSNNQYIANKDISKHFSFFSTVEFRGKQRVMNIANKFAFWHVVKRDFDVLHPTYYDPYFLKYISSKPFVLTVHDMIHEKYAEFGDTTTTKNKRLLCERAAKIIAISENTKKDLIDIFNIEEKKIQVIYEGQSLNPHKIRSMNLPNRYILFVGQRGGYKNFMRFINAFAMVAEQEKELHLICTGRTFTKDEVCLFNHLKIKHLVQRLFVDDDRLTELYERATLFVFPSEYEGFGIPILEAFACGCPVVLSNTSCFPEIAGDAGLYFDPLNSDSMAVVMQKVLLSEGIREEMIKKGYSRLAHFSWQKMGREISSLYKSVY
jgi:glycosyltransferase involved in cell wall biosynthesis